MGKAFSKLQTNKLINVKDEFEIREFYWVTSFSCNI